MKEGKEMKKFILFGLVAGIIFMLGSLVMAKKEYGDLEEPENLNCTLEVRDTGEFICFDWDDVTNAVKYSIDVEVVVDNEGYEGTVVELSFGTGDREDGFPISASELCVHKSDFTYDLDGDEDQDQLTGSARAKVKGLNPGKNKGRQNNPFSDWCAEFRL
jgi:hypothetical protein